MKQRDLQPELCAAESANRPARQNGPAREEQADRDYDHAVAKNRTRSDHRSTTAEPILLSPHSAGAPREGEQPKGEEQGDPRPDPTGPVPKSAPMVPRELPLETP